MQFVLAKSHWNWRKHVRRFLHKCSRALPVSLWRLILQLKVVEFQFFNLLSKINFVKLSLWRLYEWCFSRASRSHHSSFSTTFVLDSHHLIPILTLIPHHYPCKAMSFPTVCMRHCLLVFYVWFVCYVASQHFIFYFFSALSFFFFANPF